MCMKYLRFNSEKEFDRIIDKNGNKNTLKNVTECLSSIDKYYDQDISFDELIKIEDYLSNKLEQNKTFYNNFFYMGVSGIIGALVSISAKLNEIYPLIQVLIWFIIFLGFVCVVSYYFPLVRCFYPQKYKMYVQEILPYEIEIVSKKINVLKEKYKNKTLD